MFDRKFWQEIETNYPTAYKEFDYTEAIFDNHIIIISRDDYNNICYCDLEKFFDDNGIIIEITYWVEENDFTWSIYRNQFMIEDNIDLNHNKTRDEAKLQAVKKAFEIKENQLKEKKE